MTINYTSYPINGLSKIKLLWEELNKTHLIDSVHFKEHYSNFTFEKRIENWEKLPEDLFFLLMAETEDLVPVGYCVSTIDQNKKGEIDSLFVDPNFRQQGIGKVLMTKSMEWLQGNQCNSIRLSVSYGHESVFSFYQKLEFYPRLTTLEWKNKHQSTF